MFRNIKYQITFFLTPLLTLLVPQVTFAISGSAFGGSVSGFVCLIMNSINIIIPILSTAALLFFFWGIAKFLLNANNEKEIASGRRFMFWSVVALFVFVAFWGIMNFLSAQFGFGTPILPLLPGDNNASGCPQQEVVTSGVAYPPGNEGVFVPNGNN